MRPAALVRAAALQVEVFRWADVAATAAAGSRSVYYPEALASAAWGAVYRGDLQAADTGAHAALDAAQGMAPITGRRALQALGDLAIYRGDLERAANRYLRAYELSTQAGDWLDAAWDAASAGVALAYGNHLAEAGRLAGHGRDAAVRSGAPSALALVLCVLARSLPAPILTRPGSTSNGPSSWPSLRVAAWSPGSPRSHWPPCMPGTANLPPRCATTAR